jgi:light-regulated signal transduction histidine kinase (bacteriophytochrome)
LSNAIEFTAAGGSVEVTLSIENDAAVVSVRDTGIGFESAFSERLFEPSSNRSKDAIDLPAAWGRPSRKSFYAIWDCPAEWTDLR